ncbi:MAG: type II toxin-antitoxin system VapB family antitoxin [Devosia sp.]
MFSTMNSHSKIEPVKQLNLKDNRTYELATEVANMHGISRNAAVKAALEEKLRRDIRALSRDERLARMDALIDSYASRAGPRAMTDEDAIGYDEFGLPT